MAENNSVAQKHTSGEAPRRVRCAILPVVGYARVHRSSRPVAELAARCSPQPRAHRSSQPARSLQPHVALVDTSVYLKPTELVNVALDMLARLAPCLNLGVGELGHKDLLDTIGADNRRK